MNSAAAKALDALKGLQVAASPVPWGQWPRARLDIHATIHGDKESIATFDDDLPSGDGDTDEDDDREEARATAEANARLTVAAVNLSAPLAAVARAAMALREAKRRAWRDRSTDPRKIEELRDMMATAFGALDAALDALEAAAEGGAL